MTARCRTVCLLVFLSAAAGLTASAQTRRESPRLTLQLIVAPTAPAAVAMGDILTALKNKYPDGLDTGIFYFVTRDSAGRFTSPLGPEDYAEAKRQAVIRANVPGKLRAYLAARNSELYSPVWEHAALWAGLDPERLQKMIRDADEEKLWTEDLKLIRAVGLSQPPAFVLNHRLFAAGETGLTQVDAAMQTLLGRGREAFHVRLVYDPQAPQPAKEEFVQHVRKNIPGAAVEEVPLSADLAALFLQEDILELPALLFDHKFITSFYAKYIPVNLAKRLETGEYYLFVKHGDTILGRPSKPESLAVFVQSHCPFAAQFLIQLLDKKDRGELKQQLGYPVFLIQPAPPAASATAGGRSWTSLHGAEEVEEDARQLAIQKYYPDNYWAYVRALYPDNLKDWAKALDRAKIPAADLARRIDGERQALLEANLAALNGLTIDRSPTVLVDNRYFLSDRNKYFNLPETSGNASCGH